MYQAYIYIDFIVLLVQYYLLNVGSALAFFHKEANNQNVKVSDPFWNLITDISLEQNMYWLYYFTKKDKLICAFGSYQIKKYIQYEYVDHFYFICCRRVSAQYKQNI